MPLPVVSLLVQAMVGAIIGAGFIWLFVKVMSEVADRRQASAGPTRRARRQIRDIRRLTLLELLREAERYEHSPQRSGTKLLKSGGKRR